MGKYIVEITDVAKKHLLLHKKSGHKSNIKRIENIIRELSVTPYYGIGKPEKLKYQYSGYWSRRINKKDRMIYKVSDAQLLCSLFQLKDIIPTSNSRLVFLRIFVYSSS